MPYTKSEVVSRELYQLYSKNISITSFNIIPTVRDMLRIGNVNTYGLKLLTIGLGLHRALNSTYRRLPSNHGADLLKLHGLLVSMRNRCALDPETKSSSREILNAASYSGILPIGEVSCYHNLLQNFLNILNPATDTAEVRNGVYHQIETPASPVAELLSCKYILE